MEKVAMTLLTWRSNLRFTHAEARMLGFQVGDTGEVHKIKG